MATKDFSGMDTGRKGQQGTATLQEIAQRRAEGRTQGRKGCKATRINMAFYSDNYEFVRIMARATGHTMTELVNIVLDAYRNEHPEMLEQARPFLDTINNGPSSRLADDQRETEGTGVEMMDDAAIAARRAYKRKWAKDHPDKIRQYQDRYWMRKAAEIAAAEQEPDDGGMDENTLQ